jgi:hypothetical protein
MHCEQPDNKMKSVMKFRPSVLCFFVVVTTFLFSCSRLEGDYENLVEAARKNSFFNPGKPKSYIIPAGSHSSTHAAQFVEKTERMSFRARFDSSAIYTTVNTANQGDINKLYGVSDCGSQHQENSARFGWRWYGGKLEIWAYTYSNGEREYTFVDSIRLNEYFNFEISFAESAYVFKLGNKTVRLPRSCNGYASGYQLFPYFGGDETAPHTITIHIEDLP